MRDRGIYGLVLAGGRSERMGMPKAELIYYDRPQWAYCANLLSPYCDRVYVSVDDVNQIDDVPDEMRLVDERPQGGPMSGILTALKSHPENTWLVMACDMPGIDRAIMNRLVRYRDPDCAISCFSDEEGNIEPLLSFWEAGIHSRLLSRNLDKSSPTEIIRSVNSAVIPLDARSHEKLISINTPGARKEFLKKHSSGSDSFQEI